MNKIATLITCYNRKEKTLFCLKSLYSSEVSNNVRLDVFLVDDGCTDGTSEAIIKQYPEVHIIAGTGQLFWNRGMYLAWKTAVETNDYDFYLWLNDDTFIYQNTINRLLNDSISLQNKAIICGATCSGKGKQTYGGWTQKKLMEPNGYLQLCEFFNGNIVLVPKYVYEKIGNFDYHYSHSLGDLDYGFRAGKNNILMYQLGNYAGICENHEHLETWCNSNYSLKERIQAFKTPLGGCPAEFFYFQRKHIGLIPAGFHYLTIYLRLIFPWIWINRI